MADLSKCSNGDDLIKTRCLYLEQRLAVAIYIDNGLTGPYSVTQWRCQCSTLRSWLSHSMCSSPHWQVSWSRFRENCLRRTESKATEVSRFREKCLPRMGSNFAKNALLGAMCAKFAKWVVKKWGPTCDRDISDSAIYTTAIYRESTVCTLYMQNKNIAYIHTVQYSTLIYTCYLS